MEVNRNDLGASGRPRPVQPVQGPGRVSRGEGEQERPQEAGNDRGDRVSSARDRRELLRSARARRARLAGQGEGRSPERSEAAATERPSGPDPARIQAIRLRRARIANANQAEQPQTPADRVDISNGGLTVEQARARIARLQAFLANQLGGSETQPEPPAEPPVEAPPTEVESLTVEQMLKRIARLMNAFANGWTPGQQAPVDDPAPAPEASQPNPTAAVGETVAPATAAPVAEAVAEAVAEPATETFQRADQPLRVSGDSLVLSAGAALLSNAIERSGTADRPSFSPERLAALREAYQSGGLNTAELVQRAADAMLSVEAERSRG